MNGTISGIVKAWEILKGLPPENVCKNAAVNFDNSLKTYILKSLGFDIYISLRDKKFTGNSYVNEVILNKLGYFSKLSILWYLISAKDLQPSEKLIKPSSIKGGGIYQKGSHVLPLNNIAQKYENDTTGFIEKGEHFNAEKLNYGDASIKLYPFPRIPTVLILWTKDDEFPARAELLLDANSELHLPIDIIWATAMICVLIMS